MPPGSGTEIDYRAATAEALVAEGRRLRRRTQHGSVEHVADLPGLPRACAKLVKPGGLMFVATLNKTLKSLALAKIGAEYVLRWLPPGTHDWNRFVAPAGFAGCLRSPGSTL